VLYELGIANAIREPEDIILIRESSSAQLPFDISGMNVNFYKEELEIAWLTENLKNALKSQEWYNSKRVDAAAKSIDGIALRLMNSIGRLPEGNNHFHITGLPTEVKISVLRLIDLGILWFASGVDEGKVQHAYRWTSFGRAVIKHLGIKLLSSEEFKASPEYKDCLKAQKEFKKQWEA
jgi:hypothetical protein